MPVNIRQAKPDDALALARLFLLAAHGIAEAVYRDLIPGQATDQIIANRRVRPEGRSSSFTNWQVAQDDQGQIVGAMNAFALDQTGRSLPEPLLTEERLAVIGPLIELDAVAQGTYFINAIATFPAHRQHGTGRQLIGLACDDARHARLPAVTLTTFEEDTRLVDYYLGLGFGVVAARPIVPHPCIVHSGNLILMSKPIH
jgi:ribosomal protein S18 acetylase RimI-like enzyme